MTNISEIGEQHIQKLLKKTGYNNIVDVSKTKGKDKGFDIKASKDGREYKIEVKTSRKPEGIPDMHGNEFKGKEGKFLFVADFLYVVRLDSKDKVDKVEILSRKEINKYSKKT